MRTSVPTAFAVPFTGPDGAYTLSFQPANSWLGRIDVTIRATTMGWDVLYAEHERDGGLVLSGMTSGSEVLWADQFWFELRPDDRPPVIRYWGDQVIWREDRSG